MPPRVYSSVVERCPDKTEVHGSIPCTRTMEKLGQFSAPEIQPNQNVESEESVAEKARREWDVAKGFFNIWSQIERGEEVAVATDDPEQAKVFIEKMEDLKKLFDAKYAGEQKEKLYKRVDAYIEKLKTVK